MRAGACASQAREQQVREQEVAEVVHRERGLEAVGASCGPRIICRPALQTSARSGRSRAAISRANSRTDASEPEVEPQLRTPRRRRSRR